MPLTLLRSPLLDLPGAVDGTGVDAGVADHHGDPLREQRDGGLVDRSHRGVLSVSGPDRLSWLHSLTSQHLSALRPDTGIEALVLSPKGHVEHHLVLHDDGETTWIDVEPGTAPALLDWLSRMRFLLRVEPLDRTEEWAVATVLPGGGIPERLPAGTQRRDMPWGVDLLVPRGNLAELADSGVPMAGHAAFESARVAAGTPRLGFETDHRSIPNELPWLASAVHLDKGCYRGQETVARTHNLGRPPRRLVSLHLDGALVPHGTPLQWEGRQVGVVGTAVWHHELGPVGLALVKRSTPDDAPLVATGDVAVAVSIAPADD